MGRASIARSEAIDLLWLLCLLWLLWLLWLLCSIRSSSA
jgi:hypothetical protein